MYIHTAMHHFSKKLATIIKPSSLNTSKGNKPLAELNSQVKDGDKDDTGDMCWNFTSEIEEEDLYFQVSHLVTKRKVTRDVFIRVESLQHPSLLLLLCAGLPKTRKLKGLKQSNKWSCKMLRFQISPYMIYTMHTPKHASTLPNTSNSCATYN